MKNSSTGAIWLNLGKGIVIAISAMLVKMLVSLSALATYSQENMVGDIPNFAVNIVLFISSILVYTSVFSTFLFFDRRSCDEYLCNGNNYTGKYAGIKNIFAYRSFIFQLIPITLILSVSAALGASFEIAGMFYFGEGKSPYSSGIIPFAVTLAIVFALFCFNRYEAIRYWKILKKQGNLEELSSKPKIILRVLIIIVGYPILLPYIPLIAYLFVSLLSIISLVISAPILILIIVFIIASLILAKILHTLRNRKRFITQVNTIVREHGLELSEIRNPYASLFSKKKKCCFTLKSKQGSFDCLVIGRILRGVPICFTSSNEGFLRYRIGTKKHNITLQKHFEYSVEGDGKKILIINPTPKHAFIYDDASDKEKRLYNADKLWDFVVYEAEAFIGAVDRNCLGKYSSNSMEDDIKIPRLPHIHR